jgi:putative hydrolase of the HAD superfamily
MIKAVLFDLDGTLYDRDALVAALIAEQFRVFERDLAGISRERFVRDVLEMDDHGYGEKAAGYRRVVRAWNADPALVAPLVEYFGHTTTGTAAYPRIRKRLCRCCAARAPSLA